MMTSDPWGWLGAGGGEMARLMHSVDWGATAVGPVETWPPSLKSIIAMMLYARQPMFLWWGPELTQFYNDGYVPSFGVGRHPSALGQQGRACWAEIWPVIGPEIDGVKEQREATFHEDALVPIFRNGRMEEVYWTYGYSPVFEADGSVAGVLVVVTETTSRVVALRRLQTARAVGDAIGLAARPEDLASAVVRSLDGAREDAPWSLVYRLNRAAGGAELVAFSGLDADRASAVVDRVALAHSADAPASGALRPVDVSSVPGLPGAPWPEASSRAVVVPLRTGGDVGPYGHLVMGLSPRLPYDSSYEEHARGLAHQLSDAAQRIDSLGARVAAEGARNDLLTQAPFAAALLVGPRWRFELANRLYVHMVGREVVGRTWHDAFPELGGTPVEDILARVYRSGEMFVASEQLVPLARESDGVVEERFFDFNMIPIRSRAGAVDAMMVVAVEMTAQVVARRDLERTAVERERLVRQLEAASRAKDEFVAMLGHELRNPLAPITTALRVMELRGVTGMQQERDVIARQVQHLTRLVDDLLDVSRIASGKITLSASTVEIAEIVARAIEVTSPLIEQQNQRLLLAVPRDGLRVRVDVARMTQVVSNLLANACKYGDAGGEIRVGAERHGADVVLRVEDSGVGIDAAMLPHVFDLFSQERQSVDRARGGLGLGLAIVRNLVTMHGGSVSAASEGRGKGATFRVTLPLSEATAAREAPSRPARSTPTANPRRVLIVDDNVDAAEMLSAMLAAMGHVTETANDGPEALELLEAFVPDVALLDIGLPVMDGYELARRIRANATSAKTSLFALTGYGQEEDRRRAHESGFDAHFVKPVDPAAVARAIEACPALS